MDIEKPTREFLFRILESDFHVFELISVRDSLFHRLLQCDFVLVPKSREFSCLTFALEVKSYSIDLSDSDWRDVIKQTCDYVFSVVEQKSAPSWLNGRRIGYGFVYGGDFLWDQICDSNHEARERQLIVGALMLAQRFGVGILARNLLRCDKEYELFLGRTQVWRQYKGFLKEASGNLLGNRRLGSQKTGHWKKLPGSISATDSV